MLMIFLCSDKEKSASDGRCYGEFATDFLLNDSNYGSAFSVHVYFISL